MRIRSFHPDDLPLLKLMTIDAFQGVSIDQGMEREFGLINGHDWQWRKARHLDDDLSRDPKGIFVLDDEGTVAGYISTWCDHEASIGHIPNLVVLPDYRGQGLGRLLILHALDHFRLRGLSHAKIETLEQNVVGRSLYPSLGFRDIAHQVHFVADLSQAPGVADFDARDTIADREPRP